MASKGSLDELSVSISRNPKRDIFIVTTSKDGHNLTAVPVFTSPHLQECCKIALAFHEAGYSWIKADAKYGVSKKEAKKTLIRKKGCK